MTIYQILQEVLGEIGLPIEPDFDGGGAEKYITWTLVTTGAAITGDGRAQEKVSRIVIHLFLDREEEYSGLEEEIFDALDGSDLFTAPEVGGYVEPDNKTRHITFECEVERT